MGQAQRSANSTAPTADRPAAADHPLNRLLPPLPPHPPPGIVDEDEAALLRGHYEPHDFPERLSTYEAMAAAAGFAGAECLHTDAGEFGRVVLLCTAAQ